MSSGPSSYLDLFLECQNIPRLDLLSKSDPFVVVSIRERSSGNFREVGRTETIENDENPKFQKTIRILYYFEVRQELKFSVFDFDGSESHGSRDLSRHDFVGEAVCTVAELFSSRTLSRDLQKNAVSSGRGKIQIRFTEARETGTILSFIFEGVGLDKKDFFGKSDPYFVISRTVAESSSEFPVYQSQVIKNTLNPRWSEFTLDMGKLTGAVPEAKCKFACYDWNRDGSKDLIGSFDFTMEEIEVSGKREFALINLKKREKSNNYKNSGIIRILKFESKRMHTFVEFLSSGWEINVIVGIDFTGSNGPPHEVNSLHHISSIPNQYQQAINAVIGGVLSSYDKDQLYPVYGFGAKFPNGQVLFDFHCNLNPDSPVVAGVSGILDAYSRSLSYVQLYGPTNFTPILRKACGHASASANANHRSYSILLIITDGEITDMNETRNFIVKEAYRFPLSIIIIGVGGGDFNNMNILDGDEPPLTSTDGQGCPRDMVQFVPFQKYSHDPTLLAQEVLAEVRFPLHLPKLTQFLSS